MTEELAEELPDDRDEDGPAALPTVETPNDVPESEANGGSSDRRSGGEQSEQRDDEHLQDLPDGSGCTEIWEHIAERRADDD